MCTLVRVRFVASCDLTHCFLFFFRKLIEFYRRPHALINAITNLLLVNGIKLRRMQKRVVAGINLCNFIAIRFDIIPKLIHSPDLAHSLPPSFPPPSPRNVYRLIARVTRAELQSRTLPEEKRQTQRRRSFDSNCGFDGLRDCGLRTHTHTHTQ